MAIATASVTRSVGALVDPEVPAGGLEVAFFATGPGPASNVYLSDGKWTETGTKLDAKFCRFISTIG